MPLQCIAFSGSTCSQSAIEVILVSNEADLRADSNDSSPMCISCKITKLFKQEYITKILCPKIVLHSASKIEM